MEHPTRSRLLALVGVISGDRRLQQTAGHPMDPEKMLPTADVILLVTDEEDPSAMLFRYTAFGEVGGDTWHPTSDDAKQNAEDEYGDALGEWMEVPDDVEDPHVFAVKYAADRLNDRGKW